MTDESPDPAERLYAEGKKFDWKQDTSPAAATLARANFQQAASMGHRDSVRALAHMVYEGRGGQKDRAKGLLLLWSAHLRGDQEALEEFADLLASYGEEAESLEHRRKAAQIAAPLEDARLALAKVSSFMHQLAVERSQAPGEG